MQPWRVLKEIQPLEPPPEQASRFAAWAPLWICGVVVVRFRKAQSRGRLRELPDKTGHITQWSSKTKAPTWSKEMHVIAGSHCLA